VATTPLKLYQQRSFQPDGSANLVELAKAKAFVNTVIADEEVSSADSVTKNLDWVCQPYAEAGNAHFLPSNNVTSLFSNTPGFLHHRAGASIQSWASFWYKQEQQDRKSGWVGVLLCPRQEGWHVKVFQLTVHALSKCSRAIAWELKNHNTLEVSYRSRIYDLPPNSHANEATLVF